MISGLIGAGIGGLGGAAFGSTGVNGFLGSWGPGVGIGLLVAGGAYSAATGNLDSFSGGLIGGISGYAAGTRITTGKWPWAQATPKQQSQEQSLQTDQKPQPERGNISIKKQPQGDYYDRGTGDKNYNLIDKKQNEFFSNFEKRNGFSGSVTERGDYVVFEKSLPGNNGDGSYTHWVQILNQDGNTVAKFHDTYGISGEFLHSGMKYPGEPRHIYPNGVEVLDSNRN